jgi:TonB-linked SusC/RagA family outer membrane protein
MRKTLGILILMMWTTLLFAQDVTVTGKVTSQSDGAPIPGVSVVQKGTTNGVITDIDGNYSLTLPEGATIVFTFIGMEPVEVIADQTNIDVEMAEMITDLDEVVVVGYGVQKKALVTGANANVKGDVLAEQNTGNAMEALQGMAAGVNITRNNGSPGAGTKVTIRGAGTIGNANPLYIVDGVSVEDIDYLNPADIESIDVLKDAASAAIYGSRAANGVILVTTKKGEKGAKPRITYDGYYGVQNIYKTLPVLNAQEYMFIMDEANVNDGKAPINWENILTSDIVGNTYLENEFGAGTGVAYGQYVWDKLQNGWEGTNWIEEMTQEDAPVQNHSLTITGAAKGVTYSAGFSYFDQTGLLGGDITDAGYKRITARLNTEFVLKENGVFDVLKVGENFTYTNTENRAVATGNIYWNDLHNALTANPLIPRNYTENEDIIPFTGGFGPTLEGISTGDHNPIARMFYAHNYNWGKGNNIVGNVYAELQPIQDLVLRSAFGVNAWFGQSRSWTPTYKLATQYSNATDAAQQEMYQGASYTWTNTATYDFDINQHSFSVLAGTEMVDNGVLNFNVGGRKDNTTFGLPKYAYLDNTGTPASVSNIGTWGRDWAAQGGGILSYMGRVSYNYNEKYMLDVTMRADGSSNFSEGNRWGYFPSASAGWNFSEEAFMDGLDFMTFGKLRASWGQNGNERIDNFVYLSNIAYKDQGYYFGPQKLIPAQAAVPANVPNPDVTWETSEQLNIGFDTRFLSSRLGVTVDWYKKTTKDWLVQAPILGTAGAGAPFVNGGDVENTGVELLLSWNDQFADFKYGVSLTGAYNKNEVVKLANAEGRIYGSPDVLAQGTANVAMVEVGKPIGFFYGFETDGLLQNQTDVDNYVWTNQEGETMPIVIETEKDTPRQPGDVRFVDQNNDGIINESDRKMIGSPLPDFEMGAQINAEYKGVFMNATLSGKFGHQIMQSYRSYTDRPFQNYTTQIFDRWHGEGTSNRIPRLSSTVNANTQLVSDIFMHDGDYVRINNLKVGYKFDRMLGNIDWMQAASVYMSVNNLYTFTKYDGMDPEVGYSPDYDNQNNTGFGSGIDLGLYPLPRTVMFGVNVTF